MNIDVRHTAGGEHAARIVHHFRASADVERSFREISSPLQDIRHAAAEPVRGAGLRRERMLNGEVRKLCCQALPFISIEDVVRRAVTEGQRHRAARTALELGADQRADGSNPRPRGHELQGAPYLIRKREYPKRTTQRYASPGTHLLDKARAATHWGNIHAELDYWKLRGERGKRKLPQRLRIQHTLEKLTRTKGELWRVKKPKNHVAHHGRQRFFLNDFRGGDGKHAERAYPKTHEEINGARSHLFLTLCALVFGLGEPIVDDAIDFPPEKPEDIWKQPEKQRSPEEEL